MSDNSRHARTVPTEPGWWWAAWDGDAPICVEVFPNADGDLFVDSPSHLPQQSEDVDRRSWRWIAPIPSPER